ncbi:alpha/beta fold hydrolase [Arenibaculum pallidiluteum]|uniref:alpha/beta fold hydrolase n=1 Tax=Arenibaculum pallidiluteum TaxID=2812559 RepID=UPI001A96DFD7|nr:alpha/beta fold hydrolase [Arenibaculum pallidiluteum]
MALELASQEMGEGTTPFVVLHGLFGSSKNWNMIARRLAPDYRVHALDMRNHGASPWAERMDYPSMAEDVAAYIEARHLAPCAVLGHSMGGKAALWLALTRPDLVERVIAADVAPVAYRSSNLIDYIRAMRALDLGRFSRRAEVEAALTEAIPIAGERSFLMQNLVAEDGVLRWRLNLPVLEAEFDRIIGFPDSAGLRYDGPALFLIGANSSYVRPAHHDEIRRMFPRARIVTIPDSGHWLHAEQPEAVHQALREFLED